jgi:hypothetical protein
MKTRFFLLFAVAGVLFQGCIIKSIHPFFNEEDIIFKTELLDSWVDRDGGKWTIKPSKEKSNAYEMHFLHQGEKDVVFLVHMFKLNGELYLDFLPYSDDRPESLAIFDLHFIPTHSIAKIHVLNKEEVQIKWFNEEWLRSLFDQNRIKIAHETIMDEAAKDKDDTIYLLTASTEELQKFIVKYGHDAVFDDNNIVWLKLKRPI